MASRGDHGENVIDFILKIVTSEQDDYFQNICLPAIEYGGIQNWSSKKIDLKRYVRR